MIRLRKVLLKEMHDQEGKPLFERTSDFFFYRFLPLLTKSAITGIVVGTIVTLFVLLLDILSEYAALFATSARASAWSSLVYICFMLLIAIFMFLFTSLFPEGRGSGIPRTEATALGKMSMKWWRSCVAVVIGTSLSYLSGIPVGAEGPSVQLGGGLGAGIEEASGKPEKGRRLVMLSGIAAGVATAFVSPATGIAFTLEEVERKGTAQSFACISIAVFYAYAVRLLFGGVLGMKAVYFDTSSVFSLPLEYLWVAIIAGVIATIVAWVFTSLILRTDYISAKSRLSRWIPLIAVFLLAGISNIFVADGVGSGLTIVSNIIGGSYEWQETMLLFILKFVLVIMVFRAAPTGGMMVPMLAIGALAGHLVGNLAVVMGMPSDYVAIIALITMCAFFGSCIKAPFTVILLFIETTRLTGGIAGVIIAVAVSIILATLFKMKPLYDTLWSRDVMRRKFNETEYVLQSN